MSDKASYYYDSSPIKATTNEVLWVGGDIPCLDVCNKSRLTTVQLAIIDKLCLLTSNTDLTNVVIPECLKTAFNSGDKVLLDFIQILLDNACLQNTQITDITTSLETLNPLVTVDYKCCSDNPCITTGTVTLSVALENIIICMCDLKSYIGILPTGQTSVVGYIQNLQNTINLLTGIVNTYTNDILALQQGLQSTTAKVNNFVVPTVNCIINNLDSQDLNPNNCVEI